MNGADIAFITVQIFLAALSMVAARIFWHDMRWLSYLWMTVAPLPFIMLYIGLVK